MFPELFELPFIHVTLKTYGLMMVIGFMAAVFVLRKMSLRSGKDPELVTNLALYSLIAGVIGSRIFFVLHNFSQFKDDIPSMFAVWNGGLEFVGGVILATIVIVTYLAKQKLCIRQYIDFLSVGLIIALIFGRIGCFFFGCCYGKPTEVPWAIQFPYASTPYESQVHPDTHRGRTEPRLKLPSDYFNRYSDGQVFLKPFEELDQRQKDEINAGHFSCVPIHPSQIYSSLNAIWISAVLYLFWRRFNQSKPGTTFGLMLILYGSSRFFLETLRDDNPFEKAWWTIYPGGTISQNIGIYMVLIGITLTAIFLRMKPLPPQKLETQKTK
jgi:phosphatidylglycerol:prolipoprotein diacylglycerol transferase